MQLAVERVQRRRVSVEGDVALLDCERLHDSGFAVQVTEFQAYWEKVNTDGGICDRDVKLQVKDHGYDPQKAVSLYRSMSPNIGSAWSRANFRCPNTSMQTRP